MSVEIKVPTLPESVSDATVAKWYKKEGERIERDENLVDLETDKVMLEVPAPASGVLKEISVSEGDTVSEGQLLAVISEGEGKKEEKEEEKEEEEKEEKKKEEEKEKEEKEEKAEKEEKKEKIEDLSPAVRRLIAEKEIDISEISGTGKGGRVTKEDVEKFIEEEKKKPKEKKKEEKKAPGVSEEREEKRVPMSRLRARIAERLLQAQHEAAILTTFNEVNMKPVMDLRAKYKKQFEEEHGIRLGFMSFFTKAVVEALKRFPAVNASIDDKDIIYHNYYDIGIAVGSERGLVVPIVRNADILSMADIEKQIKDYGMRAKDGKLTMEEMTGGTFTITNGGVFGSMLATPIINPPQTAILGMHNIVDRPVVEEGEIVIRPIMYLALSYDHRIIDGRESVLFLRTVKELLQDPARILLQI